MIVTKHDAHEVEQIRAIAERLALPFDEYVNMVPTIYGGAETDPHGKASSCKVGRNPHISLMDEGIEGIEGLRRLGNIADGLLLRQEGLPAPREEGGYQMIMDVENRPRSVEPDEIEFVADLDVPSESDVCSCSAGADNPF
ncbi:MAG: hypothetical protein WCF33_24220 [Pseudonocardiaceae bacterium]